MLASNILTLGLAAFADAAAVSFVTSIKPTASSVASAKSTGYATLPPPSVPIKWSGQLERDGPVVNITGSHHEVVAALAKHNPYWIREGLYRNKTTSAFREGVESANSTNATAKLDKRSNRTGYFCFQMQFASAPYLAMSENVEYIYEHYGTGNCAVDAHSCGRFSCSYDSSINMCNDNPFEVMIPCRTLWQNAGFVWGTCSNYYEQAIEGQAFYINPSYNVLLKKTDPGREC